LAHPIPFATMAVLSVAGAALGVHLGRSAIAEINPAYYSDPEPRFHADLVPYRSPDWAQVQAAEQASLIEGLSTGCIGCRTWPEEYHPVRDHAVNGYEDGHAASAEYVPAVPEPPREASDPEWEAVERYAAYPVSAAEEAAGPPEPVAEPAQSE
jgi:hypothetical protein